MDQAKDNEKGEHRMDVEDLLQVRVLNIFRAEMFTPVFAISHGVRPISPGGARVARTARAALLSPRSGEKLGVLFRNRSIFVPRGLGDRSPVSNFGYIRAPGPPSRVHTIGPVLSIFWARAASDGALLRRSRGPKIYAASVVRARFPQFARPRCALP